MTVMRFMLMSEAQAKRLIAASKGRDFALNPPMIAAGSQAGRYALLAALITNSNYSDFWSDMATFEVKDLDTDQMWPPEKEADVSIAAVTDGTGVTAIVSHVNLKL